MEIAELESSTLPAAQEAKGSEAKGDSQLVDSSFNVQEVMDLAKASPDFLAGLAMPTIFEYCWPPVFVNIWNWLTELADKERGNTDEMLELFARLAIGLPRGFGKTTVIKLYVLYCLLYTDRPCWSTPKVVGAISPASSIFCPGARLPKTWCF